MNSGPPLTKKEYESQWLAKLSALLSYRTLDEMLPEALSFLISMFGATGGTLFYTSILTKNVSQGELEAAQEQITCWEETFSQRVHARNGMLQFPRMAPVSRFTLDDTQGTLFNIPLLQRDRLFGFMSLFFPTDHQFDHFQERALGRIACGICAVADTIEQAVVTRQRLSQLSLFYQMGQVMTSTFDTQRLLNDTLQLATALLNVQSALLMLLDPQEDKMICQTLPPSRTHCTHVQRGQGVAGWVMEQNKAVLLNDVAQDARFDPAVDSCGSAQTVSLLCVPLRAKDHVIGVLEVLNKRPPFEFDQEDRSLLSALAAQAAIALDNAKLYNSLRTERDRIIQAQESVRHELARNLHDGLVQYLASMSMSLDYLERLLKVDPQEAKAELTALRQLTQRAMHEARTVLFELRPVILETQGLIPALQNYTERLQASSTFQLHFIPGHLTQRLNIRAAGTIFSIVQEAVNNADKHSHAQNVWIRIQEEKGNLLICIEDDGKGFDVQSTQAEYDQRDSLGLLNMKERAELIGGTLTIHSNPVPEKSGTVVQLQVALAKVKEP